MAWRVCPSAAEALAKLNVSDGRVSLSRMLSVVDVRDPSVAPPVGLLRLSWMDSVASSMLSSINGTTMVLVVSPLANSTVIGELM